MTEQLYSDNARKIRLNKDQLESAFKIKISTKGNIVYFEGKSEDEFLALSALEALNLGFSINQVLNLKNEDFIFEKIPIKKIAKRHNLSQVRGRVIGRERKALDTIESLTNCDIAIHENTIGIIGHINEVKKASYAVKMIVAGSKHANAYGYLEKMQAKERNTFYE